MQYKTASIVSLALSLITCLVILNLLGSCSAEQMQQTANIAHTVETISPVVAPLVPGISWPVWSVLGVDIVSSLLAAIVAFRKQQIQK